MKFAHRRKTQDVGEFATKTGEFWGAFSTTPPRENPQITAGLGGIEGELGGFSDPLYAREDIHFRNPVNIVSPVETLGKSPRTPPTPPKTALNPAENSHSDGGGVLAQTPPEQWIRHVGALRPDRPLAGIPRDRWWTYCDDARWLVDTRGAELAGAGFSIVDLFEIVPGRRDAAGLVEMLRGVRTIAIDRLAASFSRGAVSFHFEARGGDPISTGWIGRAPWQP